MPYTARFSAPLARVIISSRIPNDNFVPDWRETRSDPRRQLGQGNVGQEPLVVSSRDWLQIVSYGTQLAAEGQKIDFVDNYSARENARWHEHYCPHLLGNCQERLSVQCSSRLEGG